MITTVSLITGNDYHIDPKGMYLEAKAYYHPELCLDKVIIKTKHNTLLEIPASSILLIEYSNG